MNVFERAAKAILHNPHLSTAATFRNSTIYGNLAIVPEIINGIRTRAITFEILDSDLDQAPAADERITINRTTYKIIDIDPGQFGTTVLTLSKD